MKRFCKKSLLPLLFALVLSCAYSEKITFSADSMTGVAGDNNGRTSLTGSAEVVTESMEIKADSIELSGENFRFIEAKGSVQGKNKESAMEFTCGRMTYDRETKIATLENGVHLTDTQNDVTADAEMIEYNQEADIAIMQISVTLKQKDNTCTAAYAIYRKADQLLDMSGNPRVQQGKDTFRAQDITLNLSTQEITLDGRVKGSVTTSGDSKADAGTKKNDTPPANNEPKKNEPKPEDEKEKPEPEKKK